MRNKIRKACFETNSSSVHSIVVSAEGMEKSKLHVDDDGYIPVNYGEFGKELHIYNTQEDKLSYLVSLCYYLGGAYSWEFETLNRVIREYTGTKGIKITGGEPDIDHQSQPDCGSDAVVNLYDGDAIRQFVFNKYVSLKTDCD